jgi:type VI protein secretion system component VasK
MLAKLFRPQVFIPAAAVSATTGVGLLGGGLGILSWDWVLFLVIGVVLLVAVFLVAWWVVRRQQAAGLSDELVKRHERNVAGASPQERANLQPITEDFRRNIAFLRSLKKKNGIPAIYYLPWYMIIGAPSSGKSVLLRGSGFKFCVNDSPLKEGGTLHCDWWFTNQGIFFDTAGRLTTGQGGAADKREWEQLLKLLRRFRRKRPVDGIIATVEANFLLGKTEREIQAYARQVRERIDETTRFLRLRMPIFIVVTKCDLVDGFKPFFDALPEGALGQILGWTNETLVYDKPEQIEEAYGAISERLRGLRPALMEEANSRELRRQMFPFPEEFDNLGDPLVSFLDGVFRGDMYSRSPMLAGFYFTSGTQEGTTVSHFFRRVGEQLGLAPDALGRTFGQEIERRPYFVFDLFWKVIAPAVGLTVPVDSEKDARRRLVWGVSALAAALLFGILSTVSFVRNSSYLVSYSGRLEEKFEAVGEAGEPGDPGPLRDNLLALGEAAATVEELYRHPILENWGLNKRGRLRADARELFREHFQEAFWGGFAPYLSSGLEADEKVALSCEGRTNLLLGYLGLVGAKPGERPSAQAAKRILDTVLGEKSESEEQEALAGAWAIFSDSRTGDNVDGDLATPARVVAEACREEANPVKFLSSVQNDCWPTPAAGCFDRLRKIAGLSREVLESRAKSFEELRKQLEKRRVDQDTIALVKDVQDEVRRATGKGRGRGSKGALLGGEATAATADATACVAAYFKSVAPDVKALVGAAVTYHDALEKQRKMGAQGQAGVVLAEAGSRFRDIEQPIRADVEILNAACAEDEIEIRADALIRIARSYVEGTPGVGGGGIGRGRNSFTKDEWTSTCQRIGTAKRDLVMGGSRPEFQGPALAALDVQARTYSDTFERHWRQQLARPDPSAGKGPDALREAVARVNAELQGLQCPGVPVMDRGVGRVTQAATALTGNIDAYGQALQKAQDWIGQMTRSGKRDEIVNQTMRHEGPIAEFCAYIDTLNQPELMPILRSPIVQDWNGAVLGGLATRLKTDWQQKTLGVLELTRRYPFHATGETHASFQVSNVWLDPKAGRLMQLYYQMAPAAAGGENGPPCDLRVKSNLGPETAAFLRRVKTISDLVFETSDKGQPLQKLTFTFHKWAFAEPGAEEKYGVKVKEIQVALAGQRLSYIMDQPAPRVLDVPLPSPSPVNSFVEASFVPGRRKADVRPARLEKGGEWSPLALLKQADAEPLPETGGVRLTWKVPYGTGGTYLLVSFDGDARVKKLMDADFSLVPTDTPDK